MGFSNPIAAGDGGSLIRDALKSRNFVDGTAGWQVTKEGDAQFNNLALIGDIGVDEVRARDVFVGGSSIVNDILPQYAKAVGYGQRITTPVACGPGVPASGVLEIRFQMTAGKKYFIQVNDLLLTPTGTVRSVIRLRYTTNGTKPTVTSTLLKTVWQPSYANPMSAGISRLMIPVVDTDLWVLLTYEIAAGTNIAMTGNNTDNPIEAIVWEVGTIPNIGVDSDGQGGGGNPVQSFQKVYNANAAGSFRANNQPSTANSNFVWQGYGDSFNGNQKGIICFPYATIQADLSGATVTACYFRFRVYHTWYNSGAIGIWLGTHVYTGVPGSWSDINTSPQIALSDTVTPGGTFAIDFGQGGLGDKGVSVGNAFKNGTAKGVVIGPHNSNDVSYYLGIYNNTSMQLIVNYNK